MWMRSVIDCKAAPVVETEPRSTVLTRARRGFDDRGADIGNFERYDARVLVVWCCYSNPRLVRREMLLEGGRAEFGSKHRALVNFRSNSTRRKKKMMSFIRVGWGPRTRKDRPRDAVQQPNGMVTTNPAEIPAPQSNRMPHGT